MIQSILRSPRKRKAELGQFLTPPPIAEFMASLFEPLPELVNVAGKLCAFPICVVEKLTIEGKADSCPARAALPDTGMVNEVCEADDDGGW